MEVHSVGEDHDVSWFIVGGGVHGTSVSLALLRSGVPPEQVVVMDPHREPLAEFTRLCTQTGMEFMRSPADHHLGGDNESLGDFADTFDSDVPNWSELGNPSCKLWLAHTQWVIKRARAENVRRQGEVRSIRPDGEAFLVETTNGLFRAVHVVLAPGIGYGPNWPWWARELREKRGSARLFHAFEHEAPEKMRHPAHRPLVVGGGITAAQVAIAYAKRWTRGDLPVTMLSYHPLRVSTFDCDIAWTTRERLDAFNREPCREERRKLVDASKVRGTVTVEVNAQLEELRERGALRVVIARVMAASEKGESIALTLSDDSTVDADAVALATGFAHQHRSSNLLDMLQEAFDLPRNSHGDPILKPDLTWGRPRLFVAGALAELELGPFATNVIGARWASERIVASVTG